MRPLRRKRVQFALKNSVRHYVLRVRFYKLNLKPCMVSSARRVSLLTNLRMCGRMPSVIMRTYICATKHLQMRLNAQGLRQNALVENAKNVSRDVLFLKIASNISRVN